MSFVALNQWMHFPPSLNEYIYMYKNKQLLKAGIFKRPKQRNLPLPASSSARPTEVVLVSLGPCGFLCAFEHVVIKSRSVFWKHLFLVTLTGPGIFC